MKVYIKPHPNQYREDGVGSGGIWRIINAQARWLPECGFEIVDRPEDADVVAIHAGNLVDTDKPIIAHNHGAYWTGDFGWADDYWQYNAAVIEALRIAHRIIVPSEWVAYPIKRDMRAVPDVIPHGVDLDTLEPPSVHENYILWAKPRVDVVSTPEPMNKVAQMLPGLKFVSSYGRATANVSIIGALPHDRFKETLGRAGVWLATTRETGDIASREAMAMGVPVAGWNWGATADLVVHKETGYLAELGNYGDLAEGIQYCLENRDRLGANARQLIIDKYQWKDIIPQYAEIYRLALRGSMYPVQISVIVPSYNYACYLPECLDSLKAQTFQDFEVIVIDDDSQDDTQDVLTAYGSWSALRGHRHEHNRGLVGSLNTGAALAEGKYRINLDADNILPPDALETLYNALESNPTLDVASGNIAVYSPDGNHRAARDWPWGRVDIRAQFNHYNQLPSSSMIRSLHMDRIGGYRERQVKNEDGEYWCRAMSAGMRFEQVTANPVLVYRWHDRNKSKVEGGEDNPEGPKSWNFYYPWKDNDRITPFACTLNPPRGSWAVRSYDQPHIAVVIPCGPGHQKYLPDALDSVIGQTYQNFECIVANDTGFPLDVAAMGHPWVKVIDTNARSPAGARNAAIAVAKAPLIVPLDADDMLYPDTLHMYYAAWVQYPDSLVYGDCETEDRIDLPRQDYKSGPWSWEHVRREATYQDTILFAKQWWEAVGGYPTDVPHMMWEDWVFGLMLHIAGIGATYIERPWGVYRKWTVGVEGISKNMADNKNFGGEEFKARYKDVMDWIARKEEEIIDMCRSCRKPKARTARSTAPQIAAATLEGDILVLCERGNKAYISVNSKAFPGRKYRFVDDGVPVKVPAADNWIARMKGFRVVSKEETSPAAAIPEERPSPPPIEIDMPAPQKPAEPVAQPTPIPPVEIDDLDALSPLPRVNVKDLRDAGFKSVEELRDDIAHHDAIKLRSIKGVGPSTVDMLRNVLFA